MKGFLIIVPLLLGQSLAGGLDPSPRKPNIVTQFLEEILNPLFDHLATNNVSVPLVDLEEAGNFSDVVAMISEPKKVLDGYQSHGFKLNLSMTRALIGGRYDVVHLDLPDLFPVFGKGDFSVELDVVNLNLILKAVRDFEKEKFVITLPELKLRVENTKVRFDNLMYDPHLADFLNELLSNLAPPLLGLITEEMKPLLEPVVEYYGNGIFDCLKKESTTEKRWECIKKLFETSFQNIAADLMGDLKTLATVRRASSGLRPRRA